MKRLIASLLLLSPLVAAAADPEVERIRADFAKAKPDAKALAFYSLDWAADLKAAKERGKAERRPVFLIANTNITAGCNFYTGHT